MSTKRRPKKAPQHAPADVPPAATPSGPARVDDGVVRLDGALQIRNVEELCARLRAAVTAGTLRLDAGEVTQVDTAGLQALVAAIASARRAGASPEWLAASPPLVDAARRLGLCALLALPPARG